MIFILTTIKEDQKHNDKRCWGYYLTEDAAITAVKSNTGGMDDCLYDYLVIEGVESGIFAEVKSERWYHWETTGPAGCKEWVLCDKPKWSVGICNWGIG